MHLRCFLALPVLAALLLASICSAQTPGLYSPDGKIRFSFELTDSCPVYSVWYANTPLIARSPLTLVFRESAKAERGPGNASSVFGPRLHLLTPLRREGEDVYTLPIGKNSSVHDRYNESTIPLQELQGRHRKLILVVRLYNDGLAFHWAFPRQPQWTSYELLAENTGFRVAGDPLVQASFLPNYTSSHEGRYTRLPFSAIKSDSLMDAPVFLEFPSGPKRPEAAMTAGQTLADRGNRAIFSEAPYLRIYMAITEARLVDYAGMYLMKDKGLLRSELSPLPAAAGSPAGIGSPANIGSITNPGPAAIQADQNIPVSVQAAADSKAIRVKARLPHRTPWRVLFIGPRPGAFLESNLLTDLNDPCAINDRSWLRPGKTDFHWWNGDIVPDTTFPPGINFETNQYYIDFCARNGIEYHTVIGYGGIAWYTNDGISYQPGPHSDPSKPLPGLDMKAICAYAASKGVGIRVWVHWQALCRPKPLKAAGPSGQTSAVGGDAVNSGSASIAHTIDKTFHQFEEWGVKGMMVDFLNRDDQQMVDIQNIILRKAAEHHLHIQFHGAYKPTGLIRTWPNELTREGTLNYENDKWDNPITPDDDLNVVFTRLLAGPTDYHLGGFRAVTPENYVAHYTHPEVLATRCHMLAMYIILESYLPMVCDNPAEYEGAPGFDFIQHVPATWDETRVPFAIPARWAVIARRNKNDWWVGAINGSTAHDTTFSLDFLAPGRYEATLYSDAADITSNPNRLIRSTRIVEPTDSIRLSLTPGGGEAIIISPYLQAGPPRRTPVVPQPDNKP
jgi:alpha-glucosidase